MVGGQILKRGGAEEERTRTQERRRKRRVRLQVRMLEYLPTYISIILSSVIVRGTDDIMRVTCCERYGKPT